MQSDQADKPLLPKAGPVWYFAYGSNMRSSVMAGRSIIPQQTAVARIPTHVLTFDIFGFPYSEPSFASIAKRSQVTVDTVLSTDKNIPFESLPVHGVAYLISQEEYIRLVISEGGGVAYREIDVEAEFLNSSEEPIQKVIVSTLEAKHPFRPNAAPSARYLNTVSHRNTRNNFRSCSVMRPEHLYYHVCEHLLSCRFGDQSFGSS
ncbi:gliotoxin biosynthesis protein [Colletotrichum chrysophilum]|uniref:gamma-glutamylcyclotransferase n=1 Tax=Colletotrichum chrysophilum TaxID=1836956 RepID=A0AAD9EAA1_9PEZI|nr:gliotoxin biosynthesis protein [Colletotrichum chrysophilum]